MHVRCVQRKKQQAGTWAGLISIFRVRVWSKVYWLGEFWPRFEVQKTCNEVQKFARNSPRCGGVTPFRLGVTILLAYIPTSTSKLYEQCTSAVRTRWNGLREYISEGGGGAPRLGASLPPHQMEKPALR